MFSKVEVYQLIKLRPILDGVVGHIQASEVWQIGETIQRCDLVVRDPQLLQGIRDVVELLDLMMRVR